MTLTPVWLWQVVALAALVVFVLGYAFGRRAGRGEGRALGLAEAPLKLREESWREGRCALCGAAPGGGTEEQQYKGGLVRDNQPEVVMCPCPTAAVENSGSTATG